jgi:hypothetical protein
MKITRSLLLLSFLFAVPGDDLPAQRVLRTTLGVQQAEHFGTTIADVGDIDRDGVPDLAIGAPDNDYAGIADRGTVRIVSGRTGAGIHWVTGPLRANARFGTAVAGLGDVTGDSVPDFAVGAPGDENERGSITVFSGSTRQSIARMIGTRSYARLGTSLARIGDWDGDGVDDLLAGAPGNGAASFPYGFVALYRMPGGQFGWEHVGSSFYAEVMATIGDTNGDGLDEVAIGSPRSSTWLPNQGYVEVLRTHGNHGYSWASSWLGQANQYLGNSLASAGDLTGDGIPEIACGAPGTSAATILQVNNSGGAYWRTVLSPDPSEAFGAVVTGAGDLNGDGVPELAVGAPNYDSLRGRVAVYDGATGGVLFQYTGGPGDYCGRALAALADVDGDGSVEFAIGRPRADDQNPDCGAVDLVFYAQPGSITSFGLPCAGSLGFPTLACSGSPTLGQTLTFRAGILWPRTGGFFLFGLSNTSANGTPLPLPLSGFGFIGCALFVSPDATTFVVSPATFPSYASRQLPVPHTLGLVGARFFGQYAGLDGLAGLVFTNAIDVRIGR